MKQLVLTIAIGDDYQKIAKLTHPSLKKYAKRIGATFHCITKQKLSQTTPHWEKFQVAQFLDKYDRVLYLDTDIIVRDDCPNLFELVPEEMLGMFNEAQFTERSKEMMIEVCKAYKVTLPYWNGKYFNSGVIVASKKHQYLLYHPEKEIFNFYEQSYINMMIAKFDTEMFELPYQFNRMTCMDAVTGEDRHASYMIHYAGAPNTQLLLPLIVADLQVWNDARIDRYKFTQHIHILVTGGLGDQVNAEPAIRFMQKNVYPDAEIVISTHFPSLFSHLGLQVYQHGEFEGKPDTPYYTVDSLPGPHTLQWSVLSNLLCHTVDYCSAALLRRILPVEDKRVHLEPVVNDYISLAEFVGNNNITELALIHAGRHWETKTFPLKWWQEVVDGITASGKQVCLIGKNAEVADDKRGYVPVVCPNGSIDLRDKLSLEHLTVLISLAKVLVSNDSAPVHIAGAFDNWIVLIPSCKHPEHVLPYRYGSTEYRTKALYKRLALDDVSSQPTQVHGVSGNFEVKDWSIYLPSTSDVVQEVSDIYKLG